MLPLSVLDLVPIGEGQTARESLQHSVELARTAERLGYRRVWFAEHHNMRSIACTAPDILIAHIAAHTETIRVGAGGIMLPNHAPLRVAEIFHTLHALHPGRIDLGIGRAPGTDPIASAALRPFDANKFAAQLTELIWLSRGTMPPDHPFRKITVVPDDVPLPPIWLLGSSGAGARFAAELGVGYSFASHFSATPPQAAIQAYRSNFQPSQEFPKPHVILGVAVICAESEEHADYLASSMRLRWLQMATGIEGRLPSPETASRYEYSPEERAMIADRDALLIKGTPQAVVARLKALQAALEIDEFMTMTMVHDPVERRRSYELLAEAWRQDDTAAQ